MGIDVLLPRCAASCLFAFMMLTAFVLPSFAREIHVAPDGKDTADGGPTAPVASLAAAQRLARAASKAGEAVNVLIRRGTYYLPETLVFTPEDSGTEKSPVVWVAAEGEEVVVSGGAKLQLTWQPYRDGILRASAPAGLTTDQLFVDGQRQHMARYPNFDPKVRVFNGYAADAIGKERAARWSDPRGGYLHAMHTALWGDYHYLITGKKESGEVTYEGGWQNNRQMGMHKEFRFVENVFEELDAAGEWFHDEKTNTLYFYPPEGVDPAKAVVEAVRLRHLVEFRGDENKPVRFVTLRGLTFRHAARTFMDNKEPLLRSDWTTYRGGAIFLTGTEDVTIADAVVDQVGGNSIFVNNYNRRVTVRDCRISDGGANGVAFVGDPAAVRSPLFEYNQVQNLEAIDRTPGPKTNSYPADCLVEGSLIYRTGRVEKQTAPVQIEMSQGITVRHCSIYDVPRAGINIGSGAWGGHTVEFCDVFDTVKETGDHGSFNSWGRDRFWRPDINEVNAWVKQVPELALLDVVRPITLRNSRWRCDHGWDIDLDDGSSNYVIENNLCLHGGLKLREGFTRTVRNNILVDNALHPHVWFDAGGEIFRNNIVWANYRPARMYRRAWGGDLDYNFVQKPAHPATRPAADLQRSGNRDEHSIEGDAQFVDPANGDYRVKDGSPALTLGFKNFPMDAFGVTKPALKAVARTPEFPSPAAAKAVATKRSPTTRPWLGATVRDVVGEGEMSAYGTPGETGVLVVSVETQNALAGAGVAKDDVVLTVDGKNVDTAEGLLSAAKVWKPGQTVRLGLLRNQKMQTINFTVPER